jgi:hypothetical protein
VVIRYATAADVPTASVPEGSGGAAGRGGAGGPGRPPGRKGRDGRPGKTGVPGSVDIAQVNAADLWMSLDAESARGWAAYRAEVAAYLFRKFDPASQLAALEEANAALLLNPADPDASGIQSRIMNRQIPSGLARDLDIAPDFPNLSANLTEEINLVQGAFQMYVSVVSLEVIAQAMFDTLSTMRFQLANRQSEAQTAVEVALHDIQIAQAEKANIQTKIDEVQKEIGALSHRSFSFGSILSDVGSIAGVIAGIATGAGAIISIPAGLAALQRVSEGIDLKELLKKLDQKSKDPKNKTPGAEDIEEIKKLGGGFEDLMTGTNSMISFGNVAADLAHAMATAGQSDTGKLLKQQTELVRQKMVAQLRVKQANSRVDAARERVRNLAAEMADIEQRLSNWDNSLANLTLATHILIRSARQIVDRVMEDVFLAQRAREIYQLDPVPNLRFDFGYLHPDQDYSLSPEKRATDSQTSLSGFAVQILTWNNIYQRLNTAQIGFDVIHPQLSVTITDPAKLAEFASGAMLEFTIDLADAPRGMYELKANALNLTMTGANSEQSANIWITHSGDWSMLRRTDGSIASLHLLPRSELFACSPATGTLTASIPAHPQSPDGGPPFSFWGRGIATTFRMQMAQPPVADLSNLSAIRLLIDCVGYAPQGSGTLVELQPEVRAFREPEQARAAGAGTDAGVLMLTS